MADGKLTVAVTGPTGDIGRTAVRVLEARPEVGRIIGMARRPFDPAEHGWKRTEYRQGDILDRASVEDLVAEADVVVHLAFIIFGDHDEAHRVNLEGSRNVFEATAAAGAKRLVYTSSVAAYGFEDGDRGWLTEDMPAARLRGLLLLGAQGGARAGAGRVARGLGHRRLRLSPLHRRRRRRADAGHDDDHGNRLTAALAPLRKGAREAAAGPAA